MRTIQYLAPSRRRSALKIAIVGLLATTAVATSVAPSLALPGRGDTFAVADAYNRSDSFRHHFYRGQYNHGEHAGKPRYGSGEMWQEGTTSRAPLGVLDADALPVR